ncbi:hypothetical protein [Burkholderia glumae]|uniref:Uncharacterized protein n=1 Tax=Burkholderia glumae TaxID=337 RepID=A0ABY5B9S6_BURGL|nr:hypothetical protein [Burkholderia glumae]USS42396.1 hypothetical protein NFI99_09270 [Burkholderia glumae]
MASGNGRCRDWWRCCARWPALAPGIETGRAGTLLDRLARDETRRGAGVRRA